MDLIVQYVGSCVNGKVAAAECGDVWQFLVIAALIVAAVGALVVIRVRAGRGPAGEHG